MTNHLHHTADQSKEDFVQGSGVTDRLPETVKQLRLNEQRLKRSLRVAVLFIRHIVELSYRHDYNSELLARKLQQFLLQTRNNSCSESGIVELANALYDDIITKTKERFKHLKEKDQVLLALYRLGFSNVEILSYLQLNSTNHIYQLKFRLCKKLNVSSLGEYFNSLS